MRHFWILIIFFFGPSEDQSLERLGDEESNLRNIGWHLFFDKSLSPNNNISCSSCHSPDMAFTDGYRKSFNSYAEPLKHNAPTLLNLENNHLFNWHSPDIHTIIDQLTGPLYATNPVEMELSGNEEKILDQLGQRTYIHTNISGWEHSDQCQKLDLIQRSLAVYVTGLVSRNSSWDQKRVSGNNFIEISEGEQLFKKLGCDKCHGGVDFDLPLTGSNMKTIEGNESMPYRIPTLRNVQLTSPYWHDGSEVKIASAIRRHLTYKDIPESDLKYIIEFLYTLTDTSYYNKKFFHDPFL